MKYFSLQSSLPLRKQVRASKMNNSYQAVTSATAQRILETLDKMSTPLGVSIVYNRAIFNVSGFLCRL